MSINEKVENSVDQEVDQEKELSTSKERVMGRIQELKSSGKLPGWFSIPGFLLARASDKTWSEVESILESLNAGKTLKELGLPVGKQKENL